MNIENIKQKFKQIEQIYFNKENNIEYLNIQVNLHKMNDVENISKEISDYIDVIDETDRAYYLNIFSSGTESEIEVADLKKHLDKQVKVLFNEDETNHELNGLLIEVDNESIIVKWNQKGQFKKTEILLKNIIKINASAKI